MKPPQCIPDTVVASDDKGLILQRAASSELFLEMIKLLAVEFKYRL